MGGVAPYRHDAADDGRGPAHRPWRTAIARHCHEMESALHFPRCLIEMGLHQLSATVMIAAEYANVLMGFGDGIVCIVFAVLPIAFLIAAIKNWGRQPPCYHCGHRNRVHARYCAQCGARLL